MMMMMDDKVDEDEDVAVVCCQAKGAQKLSTEYNVCCKGDA